MILRIFSSIGSGIQVSYYGVIYHLITLASLVILLVQEEIRQLLHLQITL